MSHTETHPANGGDPDNTSNDTVGDDLVDAIPPTTTTATEMTRRTRPEGTLMPLPAEQVVQGMRAYQQLLKELLEPSDWQTHDGNLRPLERPFLKKSGWRKIARAFNLSFECVHSKVERDEHGSPERAEVWIRAVAPNGQYGDGDGYCSADEGRFQSRRGRQKLENDLRATAATRAKNRATADLVGMGEVSAEEINPAGAQDPAQQQALTNGTEASSELGRLAFTALTQILGSHEAATEVAARIVADDGYLSAAAGRTLIYVAAQLDRARPQPEPVAAEDEPPPPSTGSEDPDPERDSDTGV